MNITHLGYPLTFRIKINTLATVGLVSPGLGVVKNVLYDLAEPFRF
jgi:hypothetical protein